jgi:hypothetical protein
MAFSAVTYKGRVGLGLTTWKRPGMYAECRDSVLEHLAGVVDEVIVIQDGGDPYILPGPKGWHMQWNGTNRGWADSKNGGLQHLLDTGCDWLFMIEDDTLVTAPEAVTGYIDAHLASGLHYMTAHPWGETTTTLVEAAGLVSYWAYVGSWWTFMTREGLQTGGGYNDVLGGIMGDIELPQRWSLKGLTSGWGRLPDATGSEQWVTPRCLTIDQSTIANQPGWAERQEYLLRWWAETMPETLPCEMKPAREGRPSRMCDDVKARQSAAAVANRFI